MNRNRSNNVNGVRVQFLKFRNVGEGGADGEHTVINTLKLPKGISRLEAMKLLTGMYAHHCYCTHDCCAHWFSNVWRISNTKRREWTVEVYHARNI